MEMKLVKLIIDNFRCIKHFEINADGENVYIQGKNGSGKTTIYDSFLWVLFGKNSLNESKFSIRPSNAPNEIEPSVSVTFMIDETEKEFKKVFVSKYSRDTGEFRESKLECFINGVPKKIREYESEISEIIDENLFKLLTNSRYFNESINWKDRRKILFEVCGVMSEVDVCNTDEKFNCLIEQLEKFGTSEEYKKSLTADKKNISKEINNIKPRIDEVYKQIDTSIDTSIDIATEQANLDVLNTQYSNLLNESSKLKNGTSNVLDKQIQEHENNLFELNKANREFVEQQKAKNNLELSKWQDKERLLKQEQSKLENDVFKTNNHISENTTQIKQIRDKYKALNAKQWQGDTVCPTCNQSLPSEQVETAKAQFNSNKSKSLEKLQLLAERLKSDNEKFKATLSQLEKAKNNLTKDFEQLEKEKPIVTDTPFNLPDFEEKKKDIESKIRELTIEKEKSSTSVVTELQKIASQVDDVQAKIKECNSKIATIETNNKLENRIEELRQEQKNLQAKQSENLKMLDLLDDFIEIKVKSIEKSINDKFKIARFKLFEQNKTNDSLNECCEVICNNSPRYNDINNAGKTIVGIDIIQTLAKHYEKNVPIFIDNVDSLDTDNINKVISDIEQQIITLKVSDDTQLIIKE